MKGEQMIHKYFHDGIGTVRTMLVPWPATVWISSFPSICEALVRMLGNPTLIESTVLNTQGQTHTDNE
jgi:hypothetical protein